MKLLYFLTFANGLRGNFKKKKNQSNLQSKSNVKNELNYRLWLGWIPWNCEFSKISMDSVETSWVIFQIFVFKKVLRKLYKAIRYSKYLW